MPLPPTTVRELDDDSIALLLEASLDLSLIVTLLSLPPLRLLGLASSPLELLHLALCVLARPARLLISLSSLLPLPLDDLPRALRFTLISVFFSTAGDPSVSKTLRAPNHLAMIPAAPVPQPSSSTRRPRTVAGDPTR